MYDSNRPNLEHTVQRRKAGAIRRHLAILGATIIGIANPATAETTTANLPVAVTAEIVGRQITWRVTNHGDVPITRVNIPTFRTYDHVVPDNWDFEESHFSMHTWAKDERVKIRKDDSKEFQLTGGANGCKPGVTTAEITFADGRVVQVKNVITFQEETWVTTALPPILVTALVFILVIRRYRKRS